MMLDIIANIMIVKGCFALHFPIFKNITNSQSLCGSPDSRANSMFQLPQFSSKVIELPFILSIILKSFCRFSSRNHCYRRWALPRLLINTPALTVLVNCIIRQDLRLLQMFGLYCYKKYTLNIWPILKYPTSI